MSTYHINELIKVLSEQHPLLTFIADETFFWSPKDTAVHYDQEDDNDEGIWALLHEVGHALLDHKKYYSDIELVQMEVAAWEKAKQLASTYAIRIDNDHIEDCIDSYRDWLYKRSLCPDCKLSGAQVSANLYMCVFCSLKWSVTTERFCRPYRRSIV